MQLLVGLATVFVVLLGCIAAICVVLFVIDRKQTEDAIRHNYPVIGRFRDLFIALGEFFRQYFFALDREEMPFNRAEREWVKRTASGHDNTVAFGSTELVRDPGALVFANAGYGLLDEECEKTPLLVIGPGARTPYTANSPVNISGMSYGALSKVAVQALSLGAAKAGCWINTGEGGLSEHHLKGGADIVFQIGTAKYGVRDENGSFSDERLRAIASHPEVKMIELKLAQGAKPGKGGILPGAKVTAEIATVRGIPVGQPSLSPNRHPEIQSASDLLDVIGLLRDVTGLPIGIKTVIGDPAWLEDLTSEINSRGAASAPDYIAIDGGDGGTGAAPLALIDNVGLIIQEALPLAADVLTTAGLRDRIRIVASGKLITPADVAWAFCAGADFVVTARGFMFSIGCIQAMKCNRNTCPTGITTHDPRLQKGLHPPDKADKAAAFLKGLVKDVETIAHSCGARHIRDLNRRHVRVVQASGRTERLDRVWPEPPRPPRLTPEFQGD
jgi:glutamate synthase domain-containing protein 2